MKNLMEMRSQTSDIEKANKQILWEKQITILNEIGKEGPHVDEKIDENIKETIAALNVNGINTVASCGGHAVEERHTGDSPYPWVLLEEVSPTKSEGLSEEIGLSSYSKIEALLDEFYKNRQVEEDYRLKVDGVYQGQFTLSSVVDENLNERLRDGESTGEEMNGLVEKLPKRQQEMAAFGQFLKSKFFESN